MVVRRTVVAAVVVAVFAVGCGDGSDVDDGAVGGEGVEHVNGGVADESGDDGGSDDEEGAAQDDGDSADDDAGASGRDDEPETDDADDAGAALCDDSAMRRLSRITDAVTLSFDYQAAGPQTRQMARDDAADEFMELHERAVASGEDELADDIVDVVASVDADNFDDLEWAADALEVADAVLHACDGAPEDREQQQRERRDEFLDDADA